MVTPLTVLLTDLCDVVTPLAVLLTTDLCDVVTLTDLCVVNISVLPLSRTCDNVFHSRRLATGSTPVVGSSRKMIEGLPISAMPVLSFRLFPPLKTTTKIST